tara:strand:- start:51 stop:1106 length:1056 start_codon:yes stop_codon:yes gene_type:complete
MHNRITPVSVKRYCCTVATNNCEDIHECESFHVTRRKRGRGFQYLLTDNEKVTEQTLLKRFKSLVIPPMWQDVRISLCELSKVQAFGYDQRQRKQYIYHQQWEAQQQAEKFARLKQFAGVLPQIRQTYVQHLNNEKWDLQRSCALAVMLLDRTGIRIGNRAYQQENGTVGLTTLRRKHLEQEGEDLAFHFTGKHGKTRHIDISDPTASQLICDSAARPGYPLLRYKQGGQWKDLLSDDVNEYLHSLTEMVVSAKDFRTWTGTRLTVQQAHEAAALVAEHPRRKFTATLVKLVAETLGNTPAVCEKYYIHPKVLTALTKRFEKNKTLPYFDEDTDWLSSAHSDCEQATQKLL